MKFTTMFPETENIHLIKDVGMIPYVMYKEFGYDSSIACYKNGKYSYLNKEVNGLKINYIKKYTGKPILDGVIYLLKNSKKIDILHLFHFCKRTALWIVIYKFLNKKGKIYLKLDANRCIKLKDFNTNIRKFILKKCTLISVETRELYDYINKNWIVKVKYIPNGFYDNNNRQQVQQKQNYIITVGRIGAKEKNNQILLEAFAKIYNNVPQWKLKLIGPINENFKLYIDKYFDKYPMLKNRVIFTGPIYDKQKLENEYKIAKIFCLTSLWESFGLVLVEAIKNGCYIISSDVPAAYDVTDNCKYGDIFKVGDVDELSRLLLKNCTNDNKCNKYYNNIQKFAYANFNWVTICKKINDYLN